MSCDIRIEEVRWNMYKLLVADDEQKERNIVRILVEKQYPNLFEIMEAKSGTQAVSYTHLTLPTIRLV